MKPFIHYIKQPFMVSCHHRIGPFVTHCSRHIIYTNIDQATIINDGVPKGDHKR